MRWLGLLLLVGCAAGGPEQVSEGPSPLDARAYRWCHEAGVDGEAAVDFCDLVDVTDPAHPCAGLAESCEGQVEFRRSGGCDEGDGGGSPSSGPPAEPEPEPWQPASCEAPSGAGDVGALMKWVVAIAVALLLGLLLRLMVRTWGLNTVPVVMGSEGEVVEAEPEPELPDVPQLPTHTLMDAAVQALERGELGEAVLMARAAVLRGLGRAGRLVLHRSVTDREYGRALGQDEAQSDVLDVLRATEVHRFGGHALDQGTAQRAVDAARRVLGLLMLLCLVLPAEAFAQGRYAPYGDAALLALMEDWGHDAQWREAPLLELDAQTDVLLLASAWVPVSSEEWAHLDEWMLQGGVLVVAGDYALEGAGEVVDIPPQPMSRSNDLRHHGIPAPRLPGGARRGVLEWPGLTLVQAGPDMGPDADGRVWTVVGHLARGSGALVVVADDRLLLNGALVWKDNQRFLGELPGFGHAALGWPVGESPRIEVYTTTTLPPPTPPQSVARANLLPLVLHLMLVWLAVGLWRGMAFAPLRDPVVEGRRDFSDHVRALGLRWYRGGHSRTALAALGTLWLQRLGPRGLTRAGLKAGRSEERMGALLEAIERATQEPDGPMSPDDLEWMEELWTITKNP